MHAVLVFGVWLIKIKMHSYLSLCMSQFNTGGVYCGNNHIYIIKSGGHHKLRCSWPLAL